MEAIASKAASGINSTREAARRLGLPPSSVRNILLRILQLYPYKLQSCHELLPAHTAQRGSSRWCGVVVRRGGCQLRCRPRHLTMVQNYVAMVQNYVVRRQKPSCS
ncbi:hypothetical protein TNCV_4575261 [Trichonephila clavipes]|nr:hypothetical protein TNCV_4575261 [Trichonephila clavipes]